MLFHCDSRTDSAPRRYSESLFHCLERRAGIEYDRIRFLLEGWLSHLKPADQIDPAQRMRSEIDHHFYSAFLELYVHELLLRTGHTVTPHPAISETSKQPDFLAACDPSLKTVIECAVVTETPEDDRNAHALVNTLYDSIDMLTCPDYFLSLDVSGTPNSPLPGRKWKVKIQDWINSLNYDEVLTLGLQSRFDELPSLDLNHDGMVLRIQPIAKKESARGRPGARPIGAESTDACWVTSRYEIRNKIKRKAVRYGKLEGPYIVVVNCLGEMCDLEEISEAIFGDEGLWPAWKAPSLTRLSAVVAIYHLLPWSIPRAVTRLYHNPHAAHPYNGPLTQLPQTCIFENKLEVVDGVHPDHFFRLGPDWPTSP